MRAEHYRTLTAEPREIRILFLVLLGFVPIVYAVNSTLIFDDPGLYEHFARSLSQNGLLRTLVTLFFNRDLHDGYPEYRTYGVSKVIHFLLWRLAGTSTGFYSWLIGATQVVSAALLYSCLRQFNVERFRAVLLGLIWVASPFLVTTSFHHYSYLILPTQATIALAYGLKRALSLGRPPRIWVHGITALSLTAITLMGESHLPLTVVVFLGVVATADIHRRQKLALAAVGLLSMVSALYVHHLGWAAGQAIQGKGRFNVASLSIDALTYRSQAFLSSITPGFLEQIRQVLELKTSTTTITTAYFVVVLLALIRLFRLIGNATQAIQDTVAPVDEKPAQLGVISVAAASIAIAGASFAVPWALAIAVGPYGEALPRRYGYIPYTITVMAAVAIIGAPHLRAKGAALAIASAVASIYLTLVTVCLPTVRSEDAAVWTVIKNTASNKNANALLFANAWNPSSADGYVSGHDTPGLRGPGFPIIFESPLMSLWWQSLYAKGKLGIEIAGDSYKAVSPDHIQLTGMIRGLHFLPSDQQTVPASSVLVAFDPRIVKPSWKDGPAALDLVDLRSFWNVSSNVIRVEKGWSAQEFLSTDATVTIDVGGAETDFGTAGALPDKHWNEPAIAQGPVLNYGLESGEDRVYRPDPMPRNYRGYYETNRHGDFVYRIDFADREPKMIAVDFLDFWSRRRNSRVISMDVDFDSERVTLGQVDVSTSSANEPVTVMFRSGNAKTIRFRLHKASSSSDIPLISGIRVTRLKGSADHPIVSTVTGRSERPTMAN